MSDTHYDCQSCPAYCCAYPIIQVNGADIKRLGKHLRHTEAETRANFTVMENSRVRRLKMTPDQQFQTDSCIFLDKDSRQCTVYEGRPQICREHPGERCEWYDRSLIEQAQANGRKVILLREMPWTIDAEYPLYDESRVTNLLKSYATGDGKISK